MERSFYIPSPSGASASIGAMLLATIVCSDPACAEEMESVVETLDELDVLACECGHGFVLVAVAEYDGPGGSVIALPAPRPASRRAA